MTGRIVVFVEVGFSLEYPDGAAAPSTAQLGIAHAIAVWCDTSILAASACTPSITFYPPCSASSDPGLSTVQMASTVGEPACRMGVSVALALGRTGVLTNTLGTFTYLHIPSADATDPNLLPTPLYNWRIAPDGSATVPIAKAYCRVTPFSTAQSSLLGHWTYAQAFTPTMYAARVVRSASGNATVGGWRLFASSQHSVSTISWLSDFRVQNPPRCTLSLQSSLPVQQRVPLSTNCTPLSCGGCANTQVAVLCAQAQSCILSRCVGSPTELNNVLCGVGGLVSRSYHQLTASWSAALPTRPAP